MKSCFLFLQVRYTDMMAFQRMCTGPRPPSVAYLAVEDTLPDCILGKVVVPWNASVPEECEEHARAPSQLGGNV